MRGEKTIQRHCSSFQKPLLVSVVRDVAMYRKCIAENPCCSDSECCMLDNRVENECIPVLYNRVLDALGAGDSRWLIFCHEDFMPKERFIPWLERADKKRLYGPIGGILVNKRSWLFGGLWCGEYKGCIVQSEKDGSGECLYGTPVPMDSIVETVDCQCLVVHSSLIRDYGLRFDEALSFDLYVEDFCLSAKLRHGISTAILPINCQHFSPGNLVSRFFSQKEYLDAKYPFAEAFGCVGYTIGGGRTIIRRMQKRVRAFLDRNAKFLVRGYFRLIG